MIRFALYLSLLLAACQKHSRELTLPPSAATDPSPWVAYDRCITQNYCTKPASDCKVVVYHDTDHPLIPPLKDFQGHHCIYALEN